jgi:hypothetical protein
MEQSETGTVHQKVCGQLEHQAQDLGRLTWGLTSEDLARAIVPGKWSIQEIFAHLTSFQETIARRIERTLIEDQPTLDRFRPDEDPRFEALRSRPFAETFERFNRQRSRLTLRLRKLASPDWHRVGRHEYPNYSVHFAAEYLAWHEAHHLYQVLQRRIQIGPLPD